MLVYFFIETLTLTKNINLVENPRQARHIHVYGGSRPGNPIYPQPNSVLCIDLDLEVT